MKKKQKFKFKCRYAVYALLLALLYIVIGTMAPFARYKELKESTLSAMTHMEIFAAEGSIDRAVLLETSMSALLERIRLLNLAKERIILSTFMMNDSESTRDLASILLHKADLGVKVYIYCDGYYGTQKMEGKSLFMALASHPNIEIKLYNRIFPLLPWKMQGRMHDKYVIVDDIGYILGGRNTNDYFIGEYPARSKSHDREVLIYNTGHSGPASGESSLWDIYAYYEKIWEHAENSYLHEDAELAEKEEVQAMRLLLAQRYAGIKAAYPELFEAYDYAAHSHPVDGIELLSNPTTIYAKEPVVFYQLIDLMKQAEEQVLIHTPYIVCNQYMYQKLEELVNAVPACKMMVNSVENGNNLTASSDYLIHKKDVIKTGMPLLEYDGGISYHGKSVVIDERISIIGSFNFDLRSTYMDTELMLAIKSESFAKELRRSMEAFERDCRIVVDQDTYITPEHIVVKKIPFGRNVQLKIFGLLLQPFRYVL